MNRRISNILAFGAYFIGLVLGLLLKFNIGLNNSNRLNIAFNNLYSQSKFQLFKEIFINNILVVLFNILGALSFGVVSIINTIYNGIILGYTISSLQKHFSIREILSHTFPHCIEIVGIILSCKLGIELGLTLFKKYFKKSSIEINTAYYIKTFLVVIIIILIASGLEVEFMR